MIYLLPLNVSQLYLQTSNQNVLKIGHSSSEHTKMWINEHRPLAIILHYKIGSQLHLIYYNGHLKSVGDTIKASDKIWTLNFSLVNKVLFEMTIL